MIKSIEFHCEDYLRGCIPEPSEASKFIPSYFRSLPSYVSGDLTSATAKKCIPFLEAVSAGFIIPLCTDVMITVKDGDICWHTPDKSPISNIIETHTYDQIENYPLASEPYGKMPLKFVNPWVIKTPKSVSCLFTPCLNHFENRFLTVSGIVDTDNYYNSVNFPFIWTGGEGQFLLEKGTPLVHVIPIQRKVLKSRYKDLDIRLRDRVINMLSTTFVGGYKSLFWHKLKDKK